jgi:cytochrome c-type biogenesis protein CcmH/NrfG
MSRTKQKGQQTTVTNCRVFLLCSALLCSALLCSPYLACLTWPARNQGDQPIMHMHVLVSSFPTPRLPVAHNESWYVSGH